MNRSITTTQCNGFKFDLCVTKLFLTFNQKLYFKVKYNICDFQSFKKLTVGTKKFTRNIKKIYKVSDVSSKRRMSLRYLLMKNETQSRYKYKFSKI